MEAQDSVRSKAAALHRPRSRLGKLLRVLLAIGLVLCLVATATLWTVTRSWFIISRLEPELERKLGGEVTIGRAEYQGGGRIVFADMSLRARTLTGKAAHVAFIGRAEISIDPGKLLTGNLHVSDVKIDDAVLRLSEDLQPGGRPNFRALEPVITRGGTGHPTPPRVRIRNATLEFGQHDGSNYQMLGQRIVSGEMYPSANTWYMFELREVGDVAPNTEGIFIKGEWNAASNEHHSRIEGLDLDDRIYNMCPQAVRQQWDLMQLEGKVGGMTVDWTPGQPFSIEFGVKNVALTLPIETGGLWARYKGGTIQPTASRPRMHVNSGTIKLGADSIVLDRLTGQLTSTEASTDLVGVPYQVSFAMRDLPPIDWNNRERWMDEALRTSPFDLEFRVENFSLQRTAMGDVPAIDLPLVVAKVLAKFHMTDLMLSTSLQMTRGPATRDADGRLVEAKAMPWGQATIRNASGKYQKFQYQLDDVDAYLEFDSEKVVVHRLTGRGSGNSQFRIYGQIAPPDNDSAVTLHVSGTNVPMDDRLRQALTGGQREAFDSMFHAPSNEALAAAGMLPDQDAIDAARQEQRALEQELALVARDSALDQQAKAAKTEELQGRLARLQRHVQAGAFRLGGTVNIELQIERAFGPKQPTITSGTFGIQSMGILYENFPYPLRVVGGELDWQHDRVAIKPGPDGRGLPFIAPGGGIGSVTGQLLLSKEGSDWDIRPEIAIAVQDDEISDAVYAAIPMSDAERAALEMAHDPEKRWPGGALCKAARIVKGIGLSGSCDCSGTIFSDQDDHIDFDFALTLDDGVAQPNRMLTEALEAHGDLWPAGTTLNDVRGELHVSRKHVQWINVTGRSDQSMVVANGLLDLAGDQSKSDISLDFQDLPVGDYVLGLAQPEVAARAKEYWNRYRPQGFFDAKFEYRDDAAAPPTSLFTIYPRDIKGAIGSQQVSFKSSEGTLTLDGRVVGFEDLQVSAGEGDQLDGSFRLQGEYPLHEDPQTHALVGSWTAGRFESPIILELLDLLELTKPAEQYRQMSPLGLFDADFVVQSAGNKLQPDYQLNIRPRSLQARWDGKPFEVTIDKGQFIFTPGQISIDGLQGEHADGTFALSGEISTRELIDARLKAGYSGSTRSELARAFLPLAAVESLEAIELKDTAPNTRADLTLRITETPVARDLTEWSSLVQGIVETRGASLVAGLEFTDINGSFGLEVEYTPTSRLKLSIVPNVQRATVLGQVLTDLEAPLTLIENGEVIHMPLLRADAGAGAVSARGRFGIGTRRDYEAFIELVDVPLQRFVKTASANGTSSGSAGSTSAGPSGDIFASMSISGLRDDPQSRRGRGLVRILHGTVAEVPLALQVMQVVQLTMPFTGGLDYADADMYLSGDRMIFEQLLFENTLGDLAPLQLFGEGEINIDTLELDVRFRCRSGLVVIRDIIGGIGDQLYEIHVTGPLGNPQARVALPSMK